MASSNMDEARDVVLFNRETGEVLGEMQTITLNTEETAGITINGDGINLRGANITFQADRNAAPVPMGATQEVTAEETINTRTRQSGASRSIAGGTIDRQNRQEESDSSWRNVDSWGWLGGPDMIMRTGTIAATSINVDSLRTSVLNMEDNGELDMIGELPSENVRNLTITPQPLRRVEVNLPTQEVVEELEAAVNWTSESIRYEELEPVEVPVDGQLRTAEGLGTNRILFSNGSEIRGLRSEDIDSSSESRFPSSYMGDGSHLIRMINEAPTMEPSMATHIDLNGVVSFSNLTSVTGSRQYTDLSTARITNQAVEAVRSMAQPYIERTVPESMGRVSAVAENAGTFITVPDEGYQEWRSSGDSWVSQGIYENENGNKVFHKGCWFFGDAMDILEGKTIHNATLKMKKSFSVGGDDVKAYVVGHPHNTLPTTEPYITKLSVLKRIRAHELDHVFVDLVPFKDLISRGLIKGFGVYTDETGITEFASFDREAELEITWY